MDSHEALKIAEDIQLREESITNAPKCGQPYRYPLPESDKDPSWATLLEPLLAKDKVRCEAWKEEVQNLLIFAGLFSAVVTAFVVESCKRLQQDPSETTAVLLSQILASLQASSNSTTTPSNLVFQPSTPDVRINTFWFLSLMFSLTTVVVGIVSLQWLREYQRRRDDLTPRVSFSLYHMHAEGLEQWFVPQVFTALPLLLQTGLILFMIGIIDFLWHTNRTVAIPVLLADGLVLSFLVASTVLPTFQALTLYLPRWKFSKGPRVQCPYKSPQAWAFHRLVMAIKSLISKLFATKVNVHIYERLYATFPREMVFRNRTGDNWLEHGIGWLFQRDIDRISTEEDLKPITCRRFTLPPMPLYDAVHSLLKIKESSHSWRKADVIAAYNCFDSLSHFSSQPTVFAPTSKQTHNLSYNDYLGHLLELPFPRYGLPAMESVPAEALHENNVLGFHTWRYPFYIVNRPVLLKRRAAEISVRLTWHMFCGEPQRIRTPVHLGWKLPLEWVSEEMILANGNLEAFQGIPEHVNEILQTFFQTSSSLSPHTTEFGTTTHTSIFLRQFLESAATIMSFNPCLVQSTLAVVEARLREILAVPTAGSSGYFFFCTSIYTRQLLESTYRKIHLHPDQRMERDILTPVISLLQEYKAYSRNINIELGQCLGIPNLTNDWWDFLVSHHNPTENLES